jgi:hypothetical protein
VTGTCDDVLTQGATTTCTCTCNNVYTLGAIIYFWKAEEQEVWSIQDTKKINNNIYAIDLLEEIVIFSTFNMTDIFEYFSLEKSELNLRIVLVKN